MAERQLNLYSTFSYTDAYFALTAEERQRVRTQVAEDSGTLAESTSLYSVYPARSDVDVLIWSAWQAENDHTTKEAFLKYARTCENWRQYLRPVQTLWGFTGVSTYARGKSEQDIDPFDGQRSAYFVIYPFSKTKDWYLMSADARQGQMNEHIKLGKQYPNIKQLLLYSFGLQDQEFVVAYEMEDVALFSDLVRALRGTEARRHTALDTPLITGIFQTPGEFARS